MSKTAAAIMSCSRCRERRCFPVALPLLPANGLGYSAIVRFSIIIPSLQANSMYWPEAHGSAEIADCGIDDGFDMRRARYSAAYSEEGLLVSKVAADPEGHIFAPNKARTTTRLIEPTSVVESLMQINGPCRSLEFTFEVDGSASQDSRARDFGSTFPAAPGARVPAELPLIFWQK
jgi:hypothetical protein